METVAPEDVGFSSERLRRVDSLMQGYVDSGRLAGTVTLLAREGQVFHFEHCGVADVQSGRPMDLDTIFRIYSMTKPITSVAVMQLVEEGRLRLRDPLADVLPEFADPQVFVGGTVDAPELVPADRSITIADLLSHTSGLSYSILDQHPVDEIYRRAGLDAMERGGTLADTISRLAGLPLRHHPGTRWSYSMATDVLGRVVEVLDDRPFADCLAARILEPLGMHDTSFLVPDERVRRLSSCYGFAPGSEPALLDAGPTSAYREPSWQSGGGGLVSTTGDYHRFCSALLGGGELDGARILGPRTVRSMMSNHLPGGAHLDQVGDHLYTPGFFAGCGFGLGFATVEDPVVGRIMASRGEASWGGMASTAFWVDPAEGIHAVFMTQLVPSGTHVSLRWDLRALVNQAILD